MGAKARPSSVSVLLTVVFILIGLISIVMLYLETRHFIAFVAFASLLAAAILWAVHSLRPAK